MKKKIKDVTFAEFVEWANRRACDGKWDLQTAATCCELIGDIYKQTRYVLFRKKKKQEELFEYYKPLDFNLDVEIELN